MDLLTTNGIITLKHFKVTKSTDLRGDLGTSIPYSTVITLRAVTANQLYSTLRVTWQNISSNHRAQ